jgi:hypothetical protein
MNDPGAAEARLTFTGREGNNKHKKAYRYVKSVSEDTGASDPPVQNLHRGKNYFQPEAITLHLTDHFSRKSQALRSFA